VIDIGGFEGATRQGQDEWGKRGRNRKGSEERKGITEAGTGIACVGRVLESEPGEGVWPESGLDTKEPAVMCRRNQWISSAKAMRE
jgi:hypothetical protein